MKKQKIFITTITLIVLFFGIQLNVLSASKTINITDSYLNKEVRRLLNKKTGALTQVDILKLNALGIPKNTKSLKGLEYAKNLELLDFYQVNASKIDMRPVSKLSKLQVLSMSESNITEINFVRNLKNLQHLELADNKVKDISAISKLSNIRYLDISKNEIGNITPLKNLNKLETLQMDSNYIINLAPLMNLKRLDIVHMADNKIDSITPLKNLNITFANLENNNIRDISVIKFMPKLGVVLLNSNQIMSINVLKGNKSIGKIELKKNNISDISPLLYMPTLRDVLLYGNPLNQDSSMILNALKKKKVHVDDIN
ncbi:leucine-rich repeat domain-containing protein [Peribacillus glennii]|uniref:Leucine-rich repeat domain-containing protein n=1 Tax=Peribacillus glennii TaxID=2303991 RepID=A0A372L8D5_9BACI|nr:leucine-rich repeat domain-containing protein [Peribacillus glennii]RFU61292.1 leucine-rich repeat domain-containing protein [Peribacillus glennii]